VLVLKIVYYVNTIQRSVPWMIKDAQSKKTLETLFGCGLNSCRANILSKMRPGSGNAPR
jgi:hypothetical protein